MIINSRLSYHCLPYTPEGLTTRFAPLMHQVWALLLHSGAAQHPHGRFDILVADPVVTLVTQGQQTTITPKNGPTQVALTDPFDLLQQQLEQTLPTLPFNENFPFQGGVLGIFSYDLARRFEVLPQHASADIAQPEMAVGIYDWALIADHQRQCLTLICQGDVKQRLHWLSQHIQLESPKRPFQLTSPWMANMSQTAYAEKFHKIQHHLQWGDCYQINLAQRFSAHYQGDEWQAFQQLAIYNQTPFSAFLRLPGSTVLSLSPERFLHLAQGIITTRPIKGTRPRHPDPTLDTLAAATLARSLKDRAENLMIVDLLRNDLGRVAQPGSVQVPELFVVENFPAVHHLVSTVTAKLDTRYNATALLRCCFPGGSITGAPKISAMQIIERLEPQRRSIYCGSIGYISCCGTMDTNIVIRTLLAQEGRIHCWTGGAIVADSEVEAEYQETLDKINRILPLLSTTPFASSVYPTAL